MKSNAITRIVLFAVAIVLLLGILIVGICGYAFFRNSNWSFNLGSGGIEGGTVASSGSFRADEIRNLQIQWADGSVTVQAGDVEEIIISETGATSDDTRMVFKRDGDTLKIQYGTQRKFLFFSISGYTAVSNKQLTVTVPIGWSAEEVRFELASADIKCTGISAEEIRLDTVSGDSRLTDCTVKRLTVENVSGNLDYAGSAEQIDCDMVSGNCTAILTAAPRSAELDSVSGDLSLTLPKGCGFTVEIDSVSGRFSSALPTISERGRYVYGDGSCKITADTVSGNIILSEAQ